MAVKLDKEIFTTFEVAKICCANITSIKNWIERGKLRAFRTPGGHYRVERAVLIDFLNRYAMPNPFFTRDNKVVIFLSSNADAQAALRAGLESNVDIINTSDAFEAAIHIGDAHPNAVIVDSDAFDAGPHLIKSTHNIDTFKRVQFIAFSSEETLVAEADLLAKGYNIVVMKKDGAALAAAATQAVV
jgi:hypothetical protein